MAKKSASTPHTRYVMLHRYFTGLTLFCFIIAVLGMWLVGGIDIFTVRGSFAITWWSGFILFILLFLKRILIRSWVMWESVRHETRSKPHQR